MKWPTDRFKQSGIMNELNRGREAYFKRSTLIQKDNDGSGAVLLEQ